MCGIVSYFSQEKNYSRDIENTLRELILANTVRGFNSTGIYYGGDGVADIYKKPIPGYDFIDLPTTDKVLSKHHMQQFIVGHNRAATLGKINSENAHPFQHKDITGVHNGTLTGYATLSKKFFGTDSEHIFDALADNNTAKGNGEIITRLNGSYALMWHDASDNTIHFIRNSQRPFALAKVKGKNIVFGASEDQMLWWVSGRNNIKLEEMWIPDPMTEYVFDLDGDLNAPDEIKRKEYKAPVSHHRGPANRSGNQTPSSIQSTYGETLGFWLTHFVDYNNNRAGGNRMGKYFGNTGDGRTIVIYGCAKTDFEVGEFYEGKTQGISQGCKNIAYATIKESDPKSFYKSGRPKPDTTGGTTGKKTSTSNKTDTKVIPITTGGKDKDKGKLVTECVACREEHLISNIIYVDNAPVCKGCISSYDIHKDSEVIEGTKVC